MKKLEIRVKEQVDKHWSDWFEGMTITHTEKNETVISGNVPDDVAIYSLLTKIRDLGLHLISVTTGSLSETEKYQ